MKNEIFKGAVLGRLSNASSVPKENKDFVTSAFNCRYEIKKILEEPSLISEEEWFDLYEKSKTQIALKKTLAYSEHTPYNIIKMLCEPEPDLEIISQLISRPLAIEQLNACISVSNAKGTDAIGKACRSLKTFPKEKIIAQKNIDLLGQYHQFNEFCGDHLSFISSKEVINQNINELKRIFDIQNDEVSPFYQSLNTEKDIIPFVFNLIQNPNVTVEQKLDLIDYFGLDVLNDIHHIPKGLENYAYEICSFNCFDIKQGLVKNYTDKMQLVIRVLFQENRISEAMEIDLVNRVKDVEDTNYYKTQFIETLFENMKSKEAFEYFLNYSQTTKTIESFVYNSNIPISFYLDYIKHNRNLLEELETIPTLENNRNATSLRIFSAMVIRSINIEKLNNDDKEFLLTEYNKLLSSADKYYLTTYFTSSVNTPIELLENNSTLNKLLLSEVNLALRNAELSAETIQKTLTYFENFEDASPDSYSGYDLGISYIEGKKITSILNELIEKESRFISQTKIEPNKPKIRNLQEMIEIITNAYKNNTSIAENTELTHWDFYASKSSQTINPDFRKSFTEEEIKERLLNLPLAPINSEMNMIELFIIDLYRNPAMFNKYVDACEDFYKILIDVKKEKIKKVEMLHDKVKSNTKNVDKKDR